MAKEVPLGFRFLPTDEELMIYLRDFMSGKPLPCDDVIKVRDLYKDEPSVVCDPNIDNYFFTPLKTANEKGTRFYRTIGEGKATWSGIKSVEILNDKNQVVGYSKDLKYQSKGAEDDGLWLMKEYSIAHHLRKDVKDEFRNHVLCRIKRTPRKKPLMILPPSDDKEGKEEKEPEDPFLQLKL